MPTGQEVGRLVARGRTECAVVAELCISPHTVGALAQRLQLSLGSRVELSRLVADQDGLSRA